MLALAGALAFMAEHWTALGRHASTEVAPGAIGKNELPLGMNPEFGKEPSADKSDDESA